MVSGALFPMLRKGYFFVRGATGRRSALMKSRCVRGEGGGGEEGYYRSMMSMLANNFVLSMMIHSNTWYTVVYR